MEQEPKAAIHTGSDEPLADYEAPRVETVVGAADLEREVMHGLISQP